MFFNKAARCLAIVFGAWLAIQLGFWLAIVAGMIFIVYVLSMD